MIDDLYALLPSGSYHGVNSKYYEILKKFRIKFAEFLKEGNFRSFKYFDYSMLIPSDFEQDNSACF